jgi:3-oxoacyl-[acyl-carrier protein] reductase
MFSLSGKVALVTGASRGIGRAIARRLGEQGAIVVAAARDNHADEAVRELTAAGHTAEAVKLDVTDHDAMEKLPGAIISRHGRLDIVVSNAGIARDQLVMRMKRDDWDVVRHESDRDVVLAQAAIRPMIKQRGGRIIAISSVAGRRATLARPTTRRRRRG